MSASFAALGAAQEQRLVRDQTSAFLKKRLAEFVEAGSLPRAALTALERRPAAAALFDGVPTTVTRSRPAAEIVYKHVKSAVPAPRAHTSSVDAWLLGSKVSLGRAKWEAPVVGAAVPSTSAPATTTPAVRASIFSVADGRRLAQEPVRHLTAFEAARAARVADAAVDARTLAGLQLLPRFTPGRALLWGTILAAWGSAAAAVGSARALGVQQIEDLPAALRRALSPVVAELKAAAGPARDALAPAFHAGPADGTPGEGAAVASDLAKRLRGRLASA